MVLVWYHDPHLSFKERIMTEYRVVRFYQDDTPRRTIRSDLLSQDSGADLFQRGYFTLHSGEISLFKIECDALTPNDIGTIAYRLALILPPYGTVEGVPRGGLRLAQEMLRYATEGPLLIADDVWTTGGSMEAHRAGRDALGAVIFDRSGRTPDWVTPLFTMTRPVR